MTSIVQQKTAPEIRDDILAFLASSVGITVEQLGGVARMVAYAMGIELHEVYYQLYAATRGFSLSTATRLALDARGADYGLTREPSTKAVGFVTFTGTNGTAIPLGTRIAKPATLVDPQVVFQTTQIKTISGGSAIAPVQAEESGETGNVAASTVTEMVDAVTGVASVSNAAAMSLGAEEETDDAFRSRILLRLAGLSRGTPVSIIRGTLEARLVELTLAGAITDTATSLAVREDLNSIPLPTSGTVWIGGVEAATYTGITLSRDPDTGLFCSLTGLTRGALSTSAQAHQDRTAVKEYIPTGRGDRAVSCGLDEDPTTGHVDVYVDDGTIDGPHSDLVSVLQERLRGDGTERNPGFRGAGISLDVVARSVTTITVAVTLTPKSDYSAATAAANAKAAILAYVNGRKVGERIAGYAVAAAAQTAEGVEVVTSVTINSTLFDGSSAADVVIGTSAVGRATSGMVTVTA